MHGRRGARIGGRRWSVAVVVACALIPLGASGCGGDSDGEPNTTAPSGAVAPGGGLSVAEAIATDADPPLAVSGWAVGTGAGSRLCSGYDAEADPPCIEPSLALEGAGTIESGTAVILLGSVEEDTLVVTMTVQG